MFEIYGRENCQWCDAAKLLLERKGLKYKYHDIEKNEKALTDFKHYFKYARTVPQIMVEDDIPYYAGGGGYYIIGGYKELEVWLSKHSTTNS